MLRNFSFFVRHWERGFKTNKVRNIKIGKEGGFFLGTVSFRRQSVIVMKVMKFLSFLKRSASIPQKRNLFLVQTISLIIYINLKFSSWKRHRHQGPPTPHFRTKGKSTTLWQPSGLPSLRPHCLLLLEFWIPFLLVCIFLHAIIILLLPVYLSGPFLYPSYIFKSIVFLLLHLLVVLLVVASTLLTIPDLISNQCWRRKWKSKNDFLISFGDESQGAFVTWGRKISFSPGDVKCLKIMLMSLILWGVLWLNEILEINIFLSDLAPDVTDRTDFRQFINIHRNFYCLNFFDWSFEHL